MENNNSNSPMFTGTKERIVKIIVCFLSSVFIGLIIGNMMCVFENLIKKSDNDIFTIACIVSIVIFTILCWFFVFRRTDITAYSKTACVFVSYLFTAGTILIFSDVWYAIFFGGIIRGADRVKAIKGMLFDTEVMFMTFLPLSLLVLVVIYVIYMIIKVRKVLSEPVEHAEFKNVVKDEDTQEDGGLEGSDKEIKEVKE